MNHREDTSTPVRPDAPMQHPPLPIRLCHEPRRVNEKPSSPFKGHGGEGYDGLRLCFGRLSVIEDGTARGGDGGKERVKGRKAAGVATVALAAIVIKEAGGIHPLRKSKKLAVFGFNPTQEFRSKVHVITEAPPDMREVDGSDDRGGISVFAEHVAECRDEPCYRLALERVLFGLDMLQDGSAENGDDLERAC